MVKVRTITHDAEYAVVRSPTAQHPFARAREFQRALIATKLEKIFAKPFIGNLTGHSDGITCLAKCPTRLQRVLSGAHDGEIRLWDLAERKSLISIYDHERSIKGVCFSRDGQYFLSSAADKVINLYDFKESFAQGEKLEARLKFMSKLVIGMVDHNWERPEFATAGQFVQIWSYDRSKPILKLPWGSESITQVRYNPSSVNILAGTGMDRSITLYDIRGETPVQKIYMANKCSCICWNPIEPINFTVGSDDTNCYSFDMRKMDKAKVIHKDHISAVTDIDFAPTGREFVTGSFDRTIRIFDYDQGRSKEVYHGKRMQMVSSVLYTMDSHYILSGSEDMNIRIWKAKASRPIGTLPEREERAIQYRQKLVEKFKNSSKVRRIARHRHLPKYIVNAKQRREIQNKKRFRKQKNVEITEGTKQQPRTEKERRVEKLEIEEKEDE